MNLSDKKEKKFAAFTPRRLNGVPTLILYFMKKMLCFVALLAMSFTTLTASAKTSELKIIKSEKLILKVETKNAISEKLITYKIDNPILGNISISVPEKAFICPGSFPVYYSTSRWGDGGFTMSFDCKTTMDDIINALLLKFFS